MYAMLPLQKGLLGQNLCQNNISLSNLQPCSPKDLCSRRTPPAISKVESLTEVSGGHTGFRLTMDRKKMNIASQRMNIARKGFSLAARFVEGHNFIELRC
jgi:hypothetical protein